MFDAQAPLHGPLDYSNPAVTLASHTHAHAHTHAGDLRLAHVASGGGAAEPVTKVLIDSHSHRRGGGESLLKRHNSAEMLHTLR